MNTKRISSAKSPMRILIFCHLVNTFISFSTSTGTGTSFSVYIVSLGRYIVSGCVFAAYSNRPSENVRPDDMFLLFCSPMPFIRTLFMLSHLNHARKMALSPGTATGTRVVTFRSSVLTGTCTTDGRCVLHPANNAIRKKSMIFFTAVNLLFNFFYHIGKVFRCNPVE